MPMRICFSPLPEDSRPKSATASFTGAWSRDIEASRRWCRRSSAGAAATATPLNRAAGQDPILISATAGIQGR